MSESHYIKIKDGLAIYKLKQSKNWYIRIRKDGNEIKRSLKVQTEEEARYEAIFLYEASKRDLSECLLSNPTKKLKTVLNKLKKLFDEDKAKITKNKHKENLRYTSIYNDLEMMFGNINIDNLDYAHLLAFYGQYENKISKTQLRYINLAIKKLFNYCLEKRLVDKVPPTPQIKTKTAETGKYFTNTDFNLIVNKLSNRSRKGKIAKENNHLLLQAFLFLTETGIRTGQELNNIQCGDISAETIKGNNYWLCQVKGGKVAEKDGLKRKIVLSEKSIECIKSIFLYNSPTIAPFIQADSFLIGHLKQSKDKYIFRRTDGKELDFATLFNGFKKEIEEDLIEKSLTLYSCRHTYITNQLKRDANIHIVAKHCGTSVEMIEKHYNHLLSIMKPTELLEESYSVTLPNILPAPSKAEQEALDAMLLSAEPLTLDTIKDMEING